jgi:hypothetical protein
MPLNLPEKSHPKNPFIDMGVPNKNESGIRFSATHLPGQTNTNVLIND